jgi:toxin FitB
MNYLLDTNVLRELGKTPHGNVSAWIRTVDDAELAISALTVREITKGTARLRQRKPGIAEALSAATTAIFDAFDGRILSVDRPVAAVWGEALAVNERHVDDAGLAATARACTDS